MARAHMWALALAIAVTIAPSAAAAAGKAAARQEVPLVPRELASLAAYPHALFQLERGARQSVERDLRRAGAVEIARRLRVWRLDSAAARQLAPRLAVAGELREVQPDRPLVPFDHITKGDPLLSLQWWLAHVGADRAEPPGPGIPVTVIDSGLDLTHPEFAARPDTVALNPQTTFSAEELHGTAVASVIGAPANGIGIVGVYPQAALRAWDATPDGLLSSSDIISGLEAAASLGRGVVNLSLGGRFRDPIEEEAVLDAYERGVVVVAAAGNERLFGSPTTFPANLPHVLTVASTGETDQFSRFSTESASTDIAAPGENIPVAAPLGIDPSGFVLVEGTSFSAPIVSGAAAWIWTARPELDKTQLHELIRRSARDLGLPGRDPDTGFGLIDIPTALAAPAPQRDPFEPNDDIRLVKPNALFVRGKPLLTNPLRGRATLRARLDLSEDPEDVYRIWVTAGRRVIVSVRSNQDVDLELWGTTTRSVLERGGERRRDLLSESARRGLGRETVTSLNGGSRGFFAYVDVFLRSNSNPGDAAYTLDIRSERARP